MESLQSCPCCLSEVEIIQVIKKTRIEQKYYFFINCNNCGKGTSNTYSSKNILAAVWNSLVLENKNTYIR